MDNLKNDNDPVTKIQALVEHAQERASRNREDFPQVSAFVEKLKAAFGADQVRVIYAREGGKEQGRKLTFPTDRSLSAAQMTWTKNPEESRPKKTERRKHAKKR